VIDRYGIVDRALKTVLSVQAKVMPARDRRLPEKSEIEYDFVAYFEGIRTVKNIEELKDTVPRRLAEYGPGAFETSDPRGLCSIDSNVAHAMYDSHRIEWELDSALRASDGAGHTLWMARPDT
jgi:hypothetical protein